MTIGTCYFLDVESAVKYYRPYGFTKSDVLEKLRGKEIYVGEPPTRAGQSLRLEKGRYLIEPTDAPNKKIRLAVKRS